MSYWSIYLTLTSAGEFWNRLQFFHSQTLSKDGFFSIIGIKNATAASRSLVLAQAYRSPTMHLRSLLPLLFASSALAALPYKGVDWSSLLIEEKAGKQYKTTSGQVQP